VVDTFAAVFPHTLLLWPFQVLVGSDGPIPFDHAALLDRLDSPECSRTRAGATRPSSPWRARGRGAAGLDAGHAARPAA
jgi:hypothetical protein